MSAIRLPADRANIANPFLGYVRELAARVLFQSKDSGATGLEKS